LDTVLKFLIEPFTGLGFWETVVKLVDILIVAYIIYRVLLMVRGTRTIAIAIGFAGIYLTYVFSSRLGLATLSNLFDAFFSKLSIFVIFALIIFQDDIRRALGRMGTFRSRAPFIQRKAIEEVVQAAGALSSKRIGAIIIFEGEADLDAFLSEGVEVDSGLTRESLFSMFIPSFENPLHDGAVVIRNYRIHRAAAIVRHLTSRSDLPKDMGTRHRAAIGVTEETDAVAIVVSEESGAISVCFRGNLVQSVGMSDLRSLLDARFRRTSTRPSGLRNLWGLIPRKARPKVKGEAVDTMKVEKFKKPDEKTGEHKKVSDRPSRDSIPPGRRAEAKAAPERPPADSKPAEKKPAERPVTEKTSPEKTVTERPITEKTSPEKPVTEKTSPDKDKAKKDGKDASLDDPEVFAQLMGGK
jgi:diadenylate cyclase